MATVDGRRFEVGPKGFGNAQPVEGEHWTIKIFGAPGPSPGAAGWAAVAA